MKYKEQYIKEGGFRCVHCKSKNIFSFESACRGDYEVIQSVECHDCGEIWTDVYTLTDVEED